MAPFNSSIQQGKQVYNCKASHVGLVYNEQINCLFVYKCLLINLLANCLHGKAAELCLANSQNNSVTTTKYMSALKHSQQALLIFLFRLQYSQSTQHTIITYTKKQLYIQEHNIYKTHIQINTINTRHTLYLYNKKLKQ